MTPEQFRRVREVFHHACGLEAGHRTAYLEEACGNDTPLRAQVEALLRRDGEADGPLSASGVPLGERVLAAAQGPEEGTLERVGKYRIVGRIGVGGMGVVYAAEQDRPRRRVALKVIRRDLASTSMRRRFEREAEVLGRLRHPGIAQIFEAGSADLGHGPQPYIAMELVEGAALTTYADRNRLGLRDKLELFVKVADAVHHAHQRGVIHRDLKPANILVGDDCELPIANCELDRAASRTQSTIRSPQLAIPKVLDFGIARALDCDHLVTTVHTAVGQIVGTIPYMSPEQVTGDAAELDTRSDVYALGVVLFELLTGQLPYALSGRALPEAVRIIREESPMRLSAHSKQLRGDLETIVRRALEKERERRYQSAADLAADIRRYLRGEPIEARRDSSWYVLRKLVNRHRVPVAAAAGLVLVLAVSTVVAWGLRGQAQRAELEALRAAEGQRAARQTAEQALYESLVAQAKAVRHTGLTGQRFEALEAIRRAAAIRPSLELRNEAIAAMALADIRPVEVPVSARSGLGPAFDRDLEYCAILQEDFSCVVVRVRDDAIRGMIPPLTVRSAACFHRLTRDYYIRHYWTGAERRWLEIWRLPDAPPMDSGGEAESPPAASAPTRIFHIDTLPYQGGYDFHERLGILAVSEKDSAIHLYEVATGRELKRLPLDSDPRYLSMSPDGSRVAVFHGDFAARACIVDIETGQTTRIFEGAQVSWRVAWHPDGHRVAGPDGASVLVWDLVEGRSLGKMPAAHNSVVGELEFSPDGQSLLSKAWDGSPVLWDAQLFSRRLRIPGSIWASGPGVISRDGKLMGGSDSRDVPRLHPTVYETADEREVFRLVPKATQSAAGGACRLSYGGFSPDGRLLSVFATADDDRLSGWRLFDVASRRELIHIQSPGFGDAVLDPGGRFVLVAGADGLWRWPLTVEGDRASLGPPRRILDTPDLTDVEVAEPGTVAVIHGDGPSELLLLDLNEPAASFVIETSPRRVRFALSADGRHLVARGEDPGLKLWNVAARELVQTLPGSPVSMAFSPAGDILVSADVRELTLWDTQSGRPLRTTLAPVDQCVFSPDGTLLAVRAGLTLTRLFRTDTLEEVATLEAPDMAPNHFAFNREGTLFAAFMARNLACYIWDLREVRAHLARLNLDWDMPAYPPARPSNHPRLQLEVDWGEDWPPDRRTHLPAIAKRGGEAAPDF